MSEPYVKAKYEFTDEYRGEFIICLTSDNKVELFNKETFKEDFGQKPLCDYKSICKTNWKLWAAEAIEQALNGQLKPSYTKKERTMIDLKLLENSVLEGAKQAGVDSTSEILLNFIKKAVGDQPVLNTEIGSELGKAVAAILLMAATDLVIKKDTNLSAKRNDQVKQLLSLQVQTATMRIVSANLGPAYEAIQTLIPLSADTSTDKEDDDDDE
jgi:hypothetical protein